MAHARLFEVSIWLAVVAGGWMLSRGFATDLSNYAFSAASWPRWILFGMGVFAVLNFAFPGGQATQDAVPLRRIALALSPPALFLAAVQVLGFYVTLPVAVPLLLILLGDRKPLRIALYTLGMCIGFLTVFTTVFYLQFPIGTWDAVQPLNIALREMFTR